MSAVIPVPGPESGPALLQNASFFVANWVFIGAVFVLPLSLAWVLLSTPGPMSARVRNPLFIGWLTVPVYCVHQFEEHGYDFRGWRYAFVPSFNHGIGSMLFSTCEEVGHTACPLDPLITVYVNVATVWIGFAMTMVAAERLGPSFAYAGLFNWGTSVVNGLVGHLLPWIFGGYNPGAVQSLFMVAAGLFLTSRCGPKFFCDCIICGILFHAISFGVGVNLMFAGLPRESLAVESFLMSFAAPLGFAYVAGEQKSAFFKVPESIFYGDRV